VSHLRAENLVKNYGGGSAAVQALAGVSFEVASGEFVAVTGPSGSGKSTILSILGGLNTPSSGRYLVDDIDVYDLSQDRRADFRREFLGFVFQDFHLVPYLTLIENAMLPLATLRLGRRQKRRLAGEALERVGLARLAERRPALVSGGEKERAAIARAVVNRPLILLADEPTGNLDSRTGREVMDLFQSLNREGMTIVMVTHSAEAAASADRRLGISDGRLAEDTAAGPGCPSLVQAAFA